MDTYRYQAFDLEIDSEIQIEMLQAEKDCQGQADVRICYGDLGEYAACGETYQQTDTCVYFCLEDRIRFLIEDGKRITVELLADVQDGLIGLYLLGSCMGALLYQRGEFLLHGSCVTDGEHAILLTGESGAGKSSLAARFIQKGWSLVTDDVAMVRGVADGKPVVVPSYPSQKLWQDAIDRTGVRGEVYSLYQEERREKFHVKADAFTEEKAELKMVVWLVPTESDCAVEEVPGFAGVDLLIRNTYRYYMMSEGLRREHFQNCVTLRNQVRIFAAMRAQNRDTTEELYEYLTGGIRDGR